MDGRPIASAFEHPPEIELIDSWEQISGADGRHPPETQFDALDAQESLRQLVALGYIEKPDENREKALAQTVRELRHNLARDYMGARLFDDAARIFEQLWNEFPDEGRFGLKLFECRLALDRHAEARAALDQLTASKSRYAAEAASALSKLREEVKDLKPEDLSAEQRRKIVALTQRASVNAATFGYLRGSLLHAQGRHDEALAEFALAEGVQVHNQPSLYLKIGQCHLARRDWHEAERAFTRSLELDSVSGDPHLGLARCHFSRGRPGRALRAATAALGLTYANPLAHFMCGRALQRLRRHDEAIASYQIAITQNPVYPEAHRRLATLFAKRGDHDRAEQHRQYADAAEARLIASRSGSARPDDVDLGLDIDLTREAGIGEWLRPAAQSPMGPDTIVVVSGLPRSGTSMMMQMLEAGGLPVLTDGRRAADANNPRGYYEYEPATRLARDQAWFGQAKGKVVKLVAQLLSSLPPSRDIRIIFMQRSLGAIVASQRAMLERLDRQGADTSDRQLAATYRQQLALVRKTTEMSDDAVSVLPVSYDETLQTPATTAAAVNRFLGGRLDETAMVAAVAPELQTVTPLAK